MNRFGGLRNPLFHLIGGGYTVVVLSVGNELKHRLQILVMQRGLLQTSASTLEQRLFASVLSPSLSLQDSVLHVIFDPLALLVGMRGHSLHEHCT